MTPLHKALSRLPHRAQVAFAAACVERVLPIYRATFSGPIPQPGPGIAVSLAWQFAAGQSVSDESLKQAAADVDRAYPPSEVGGGPDHFVCTAAACVLDSIKDESGKYAADAAANALFVLDQLDDEAQAEEQLWQEELLQAVAEIGGANDIRERLQPLIARRPQWLERFEAV